MIIICFCYLNLFYCFIVLDKAVIGLSTVRRMNFLCTLYMRDGFKKVRRQMTVLKNIFIFILITLVASCAATYKAKVGFDKNTKVDMSTYKTFAWLTPNKILAPTEDFNPVMKVRVDDEIEQAFIAKGYQLIDDAEKADFTVSYTVGNRDKIKVNQYPTTYNAGFGWGRRYYGGYYGGLYSSHMTTETRVRQYTEGKLAIDVYDVKTHQPAWHGWATKRITSSDKETPSAAIKSTIQQVISQFN